MLSRWTVAVTCLSAAILVTVFVAGCGGGSESTEGVPANIKAPGDEPPTPSTETPRAEDPVKPTSRFTVPVRETKQLHPQVLIKTSLGDMTVRLDAAKAPDTVENFLKKHVDRKFYDQTIFHYVDKGFMVLGGGFTADLKAKPRRAEIFNEANPDGLKNRRGTIAMARTRDIAHTASSQFFFNVVDNPSLDHTSYDSAEEYGYCVFGEIVEGLEVLDRIAEVEVQEKDGFAKLPAEPVVIESIRTIE